MGISIIDGMRRGALAALVASTALLGGTTSAGATPSAQAGASPAAGAAAETAISCSTTATPGTVQQTVNGRDYWLYVPAGLPTGSPRMLVLSLHAYGSSALAQRDGTLLSQAADDFDFIVAYPQALPTGGITFWEYRTQANADITYLRDVVDHITSAYCVDPDHIHADGYSLGGSMSQRLACEASDLFASVSSYAAADVTNPWFGWPSAACVPDRPISVLGACGTLDTLCAGGVSMEASWVARLACPAAAPASAPYGSVTLHTPCAAGTRMAWRTWTGLGHFQYPPTTPPVPPITVTARKQMHNEMVYFFVANPLP